MASSPNRGISGDRGGNWLGPGATTAADWLGGVVACEELTPGAGGRHQFVSQGRFKSDDELGTQAGAGIG
jgi:hypothetical protein